MLAFLPWLNIKAPLVQGPFHLFSQGVGDVPPEGVAALDRAHPDVRCWTAAVDSHLDANGYIIPGLGDAGDKIFGTKDS